MQRVLPVAVETNMTAYLFHALPLSIIRTNPMFHEWYQSHFIQLNAFIYTEASGRERFGIDYLEHQEAYREILHEFPMSIEQLHHVRDINEYIQSSIANGEYALVRLDEYAIPAKMHYRKEHFLHESLIYGYDQNSSEYFALGIYGRQRYGPFKVSCRDLKQSLESAIDHMDSQPEGRLIPGAPAPHEGIIKVWRQREFFSPYPYMPQRVYEGIEDYLACKKNLAASYLGIGWLMRNVDEWSDEGVWGKVYFGVDVYDLLLQELARGVQSRLNYAHFVLLHDHKRGVIERIKRLCDYAGVLGQMSSALEEYQAVVEQADVLRRLYLKYRMSGNDSAFVELMPVLDELRRREVPCLSDVVRSLHP